MLTSPLSRRAVPLMALAALVGLGLAGCKNEGCLSNAEGCRVVSPCEKLAYACEGAGGLELRTLTAADRREGVAGTAVGAGTVPGGLAALGASGDILLGNDRVTAVVAGVGSANLLDPNGGSLLDLSVKGKNNDALNQVLPVVGILPGDAPRFTKVELIDERPTRVAVQFTGTLDGKAQFPIRTLYEIRPCEPGLRVRTEIINTSADPQLWTLMDGFYWSGREPLPFTPSEGAGFTHPGFSLLSIGDAIKKFPYMVATMQQAEPQVSYVEVACNADPLQGFHSDQLSSAGLPRTIVPPRDYLAFERFLSVTDRGDVAAAADRGLELRGLLYGEKALALSGRVTRDGKPVSGLREASLLISEGRLTDAAEKRTPWSQVVPGADGRFSARLPAGKAYVVELHQEGRKVAERQVERLDADQDLGELAVPTTTRLSVLVRDDLTGQPTHAELFVVPADEATRSASAGSLHGRFGTCAPWLGPPPGGSPACNRFLAEGGVAQVQVPQGRYHVYAFKGPFWTLARETRDFGPADVALEFRLRKLPVQPAGTLGADLHVHGAASFDSSIPERDRVLSFAATGLDVVVATDHEVAYDYARTLRELGLEQTMTSVVGLETTGHILWLQRPGSSIPLVIGHYNFWPLAFDPTKPRNGAPDDERVEPGTLFDRVKNQSVAPDMKDALLVQLNHPWADPEFGRDLGFPRALALDLREAPASGQGQTAGDIYTRTPAGASRANNSHDSQEVMNGTQNDLLLAYRAFWFWGLNHGQLKAGTANSDSHSLTDNTVGVPRNVVWANTQAGPEFNVKTFNAALKQGRVLGTNGPVIEATVDTGAGPQPYGLGVVQPAAGAKLELKVSAAPWVPVDEVRVVVNGRVVRTFSGADLARPADPFGTDGLVRLERGVPLDELVPAGKDAWLVVEAGRALPLAGDLGSPARGREPDGVPDTSDNNGDGKVDRADVEPADADFGPLENPAQPGSDADPQYHFGQVVTDGYPFAFTNPFLLDRDGNGRFDAPGGGAP